MSDLSTEQFSEISWLKIFTQIIDKPQALPAVPAGFPQSKIIDPAATLVKNLKDDIDISKVSKSKVNLFFTTGSESRSKLAAKKAFDLKIKKFHKVKL